MGEEYRRGEMHLLEIEGGEVFELGPNAQILHLEEQEQPPKEVKLIFMDGHQGEMLVLMEEEVLILALRITDVHGVVSISYVPTNRNIQLQAMRCLDITEDTGNPKVVH